MSIIRLYLLLWNGLPFFLVNGCRQIMCFISMYSLIRPLFQLLFDSNEFFSSSLDLSEFKLFQPSPFFVHLPPPTTLFHYYSVIGISV